MFFQRVGIQRALKGLHGEADRQRLQAELTACKTEAPAQARLCLRAQLRGFLDDWPGFLSGNVAEARPVLHLVLADRIGFTPMADRGYQLDSTRGAGKAETGQNLDGPVLDNTSQHSSCEILPSAPIFLRKQAARYSNNGSKS